MRVFSVTLAGGDVQPLPHRVPPPRPHARGLTLLHGPLSQQVLARPTFFDNFDTVVSVARDDSMLFMGS